MNDISKLLEKKQSGDLKTVAQIMKTSQANVSVLLRRPRAKRHQMAAALLNKVIKQREDLINNQQQ